MRTKILIGLFVVFLGLFLLSCSPAQETYVQEHVDDMDGEIGDVAEELQEIVEAGIEEATADDSILDQDAAALAPETQSGQCSVPEYPGASVDTSNAAAIANSAGSAGISQAAYLSSDNEATIQAWFDSEMQDPWLAESEWNRGAKRWVTGDFDIAEQTGCSAMLNIDANANGGSTIGVVVMDFS